MNRFQFFELKQRREGGETLVEIANSLGISKQAVSVKLKSLPRSSVRAPFILKPSVNNPRKFNLYAWQFELVGSFKKDWFWPKWGYHKI